MPGSSVRDDYRVATDIKLLSVREPHVEEAQTLFVPVRNPVDFLAVNLGVTSPQLFVPLLYSPVETLLFCCADRLGGTDRFKLTAYCWSRLGRFADKAFHYGRAGTLRKIRHAYAVEADSLDSNFPLWTVDRMRVFREEQIALERQEQGVLVK
jgi:hypothetical protein